MNILIFYILQLSCCWVKYIKYHNYKTMGSNGYSKWMLTYRYIKMQVQNQQNVLLRKIWAEPNTTI